MIVKMLELSTANIKKETDEWLTEEWLISEFSDVAPSLNVFSKGEGQDQTGWFIIVPERNEWAKNPDEFENENVPKDLVDVINFALSKNCTWILFDRDADIIKELPKFNW